MTSFGTSTRPRLLIPVTYGLSVRYLLPTGLAEQLREYFDVVIALGWEDAELSADIERRGIESVTLPPVRLDPEFRSFRRQAALVHHRLLNSPTTRIHRWERFERGRARALSEARSLRDQLAVSLPGAAQRTENRWSEMLGSATNIGDFAALIDRNQPDAVLSLTPYHENDGLLMEAAARQGRPTAASVISWDNPTTRQRWFNLPDLVLVWNERNAAELSRAYPNLRGRFQVVGAPQFDLHHHPDLLLDAGVWRQRLSLPARGRVLLYGAGPPDLVPGEPALVARIDDAISRSALPDDLHVLVRRHPSDDASRWDPTIARLRHSTVVSAWTERDDNVRSWPTRDDLALQISSLTHAEVHLSVCSSMALDGAVFDRPQICPAFMPGTTDQQARRLKEFYQQEHWLPIARSGGVTRVDDERELLSAIRNELDDPSRAAGGRHTMLREVLTYVDGNSSERVAEAIRRWVTETSDTLTR